MRARRAGLSPSATSIRVLTATAVSMIVGKIHAVAELYPMTRIRSLSARKLTENRLRRWLVPFATAEACHSHTYASRVRRIFRPERQDSLYGLACRV